MNHSFFHPEKQYGETLPVFDHEWEAIAFYYDYRQSQTEELKELCQFFNISLDYSRGSLLEVEALYFRSIKELLLADWNLPIDEFEKMLSVYVIDCAIRHHDDAEWVALSVYGRRLYDGCAERKQNVAHRQLLRTFISAKRRGSSAYRRL